MSHFPTTQGGHRVRVRPPFCPPATDSTLDSLLHCATILYLVARAGVVSE
eukprot:SAG11_NODE_41440_length_194_cov_10.442105_1_plen_49_part_01